MALPIRTTLPDVEQFCGYLATKPTGATLVEAKAVLDEGVLDGRKLSAMKHWGLVDEGEDGKYRLAEAGRNFVRDKGVRKSSVLRQTIRNVRPYMAVVERAVHRSEFTVQATEVGAHWHQHFREDSSESDRILNDQAVCFFQVAQGADLGELVVGRRGAPTRFEFDADAARSFVNDGATDGDAAREPNGGRQPPNGKEDPVLAPPRVAELHAPEKAKPKGNRVFITHGRNKKILGSVKEIVAFGKFEPVVAQERETAAKPVPDKVMDEMRSCHAAVIHVSSERILYDKDGNEDQQINENVLIEIGAAMALYGRNFILLVEDGVKLPSNLQGLYECRYKGDELSSEATMKLLKAFNSFG
jgi:predicted nucleotide-binding protein